MKIVYKTATEARNEFFDLINAAKHAGQITVITKNGKTAARITPEIQTDAQRVSIDQLLNETAGIFTDEDVKDIKKFRRDFNRRLRSK